MGSREWRGKSARKFVKSANSTARVHVVVQQRARRIDQTRESRYSCEVVRLASVASALALCCLACGGRIDPGSNGEDTSGIGRTRTPETPPPVLPSDPAEPEEPSAPPRSDLDGFVECQGETVLTSSQASITNTGLQATGTGDLLGSTRHRTGKYFFEVGVGDMQGGVRIGIDGILDGTTSRCVVSSAEQITCSFASADGMSGGGSAAPSNGPIGSLDFVGVAVDLDEQMLHYTRNGEPLADWSFEFVSSAPRLLMAPWIQIDDANVNVSFGAGTQYPIPDGYLPWSCMP